MEELTRKKIIAREIRQVCDIENSRWFVCFGTLLDLVRDKKFTISQDVDIGIIGNINELYKSIKVNHHIESYIKSDKTNNILNFSYYIHGVSVDFYRWVKFGGMYWHTYDTNLEKPKNGVPSVYRFKSMPVEIFDIDSEKQRKLIVDMAYFEQGRPSMSKKGTWVKPLPEAPADGIDLQLPYMYGYFLDIAYPDWATERKQFGQSKSFNNVKYTKTCKGLC